MWNILVVDDDPDNLRLLVEVLDGHAYCRPASGGAEAVQAFVESFNSGVPFDAVLLDVAMPDIDGIAVLERIRAEEVHRGILLGRGVPVIMVTARPASFMKAFNGGCDDFILKPIDVQKLLEKIEEKVTAARLGDLG